MKHQHQIRLTEYGTTYDRSANKGGSWHCQHYMASRSSKPTPEQSRRNELQDKLTSDWRRLLQDAPSRLPLQKKWENSMKHRETTFIETSDQFLECGLPFCHRDTLLSPPLLSSHQPWWSHVHQDRCKLNEGSDWLIPNVNRHDWKGRNSLMEDGAAYLILRFCCWVLPQKKHRFKDSIWLCLEERL